MPGIVLMMPTDIRLLNNNLAPTGPREYIDFVDDHFMVNSSKSEMTSEMNKKMTSQAQICYVAADCDRIDFCNHWYRCTEIIDVSRALSGI